MRAPLLALVLLAPLGASGCFGGDAEAGLAVPTTATVYPPVPAVTAPPRPTYNTSDPGYNLTTPWRVGDGWDWESNATPREYRTLRVLDATTRADGGVSYRVEETFGRAGSRASARLIETVDGARWTLVSTTDANTGTTTEFSPPKPLRFFKNATFSYNQTIVDKVSGQTLHRTWFTYSFVEAEWSIVRLGWGQVSAFRVIHESFSDDGEHTLVTSWISPQHAMPVRYQDEEHAWTLVAAVEEGRRFGALQPT